jgi:hypothetical protein
VPDGDEDFPEPFIRIHVGKDLFDRVASSHESDMVESYRVGNDLYPLTDLYSIRLENSGTHSMDGILLMAGPGIHRASRSSDASLYDVAPTALRLLGLPRSREMEGRVLEGLLDTGRLPPGVQDIATYEDGDEILRVPVSNLRAVESQEERLRERLRSLGYVK